MDLEQEIWKNNLDSDSKSVTLDVRTPDEFNTSRIPNSINIDFYNPELFMEEVQKLDKEVSYFVYCRTGVRSANSCLLMKELGFSNTYNLIGGIVDWKGEIIT
tara:strand:- start:170 stop:478 length:309 start_codon:yes stop_codon:yes gene_type:complete